MAIGGGGGLAMGSSSVSASNGGSSSSFTPVSSPDKVVANGDTALKAQKKQRSSQTQSQMVSGIGEVTQLLKRQASETQAAAEHDRQYQQTQAEHDRQYQRCTFILNFASDPNQVLFTTEEIATAKTFMMTGFESSRGHGRSSSASSNTREYLHRNSGAPPPRRTAAAGAGHQSTCGVTHVHCLSVSMNECEECGMLLCLAHMVTHFCE
jgi:hypothetical protein